MHLIFLGPPASGKGTLSQLLAADLELTPLSTGVLLRRNVSRGTALGCEAEGYMKRSELVPDALVEQMMGEWFDEHAHESWLLDGFPRTLSQASWLKSDMERRSVRIDAAVSLEVPKEILLQRIRERLQCASCGFTTARAINGDSLVCPKCEGDLIPRRDDAEESFHRRYDDFLEQTVPVIEFYREEGILLDVKAEGEPEQVAGSISSKLEVGA